jgi:hypothetical protein
MRRCDSGKGDSGTVLWRMVHGFVIIVESPEEVTRLMVRSVLFPCRGEAVVFGMCRPAWV